jgi:hypothetical protein
MQKQCVQARNDNFGDTSTDTTRALTDWKNKNAEYKTNGMGPSATNQEINTNNNLESHQCRTIEKKKQTLIIHIQL